MEFQNLSLGQLKGICRSLGVSYKTRRQMIHSLSSQILDTRTRKRRRLYSPHEETAAEMIQRWWRKHHRIRQMFVNQTDFITLEPIVMTDPFYLVEDPDHIFRFDPVQLAEYFLREGNFVNPYTRRPLYSVEVLRLDHYVRRHISDFVSLYEQQKKISLQRAQEREHERTCHLLHQESIQVIPEVTALLQRPNRLRLQAVIFELFHTILPKYLHAFRQLFLLDIGFACESVIHVLKQFHHMWQSREIASTQEKCYLLETIQETIIEFCEELMPGFRNVIPHTLSEETNEIR